MRSSEFGTTVIDGLGMEYYRVGQGAVVVLVHGSVVDGRVWHDHANALASKFSVVVPTQRYFGQLPWSDKGKSFSMRQHSEDLVQFIEILDSGPVRCGGWSYGAAVVLTAAANRPDLFSKLFVYEPAMASHISNSALREQAANDRGKMFESAQSCLDNKGPEEAVKVFIDSVNDQPGTFRCLPDHVKDSMRDSSRTLPLLFTAPAPTMNASDLARIPCSVEVAVGSDSRAFFRASSQAAAKAIPCSRLIEIEGARHMWPVQHPVQCIDQFQASFDGQ